MLSDLDFKANRQMGPLSSPFADEEPEVKEAENKPTSQLLVAPWGFPSRSLLHRKDSKLDGQFSL